MPANWNLTDWCDLAGEGWPNLLVGNGLSISVSDRFRYGSLYEASLLTPEHRRLFELTGTENFETVLEGLLFAREVDRLLQRDPASVTDLYAVVRDALIEAISRHHVEHVEIDPARLDQIRSSLRTHRTVWMTSYDLVAYWSAMTDMDGFFDAFWIGEHNAFLPNRAEHHDPARTRLWWPHGAIHLHQNPGGIAVKRTRQPGVSLLPFLREVVATGGDRPLIVTEGTAAEKRSAIAASDYLTFALKQLEVSTGPIVVFGQSLGEMDQHLVDAVGQDPKRRIAYGIFASSRNRADQERARIQEWFPQAEFFDSATHPLSGLVVP